MNTYTNRKQNLMIGRFLKIYLIKTQNMFKFDLKHRCYHVNKLVPRIFVEKLDVLHLQFLPVRLD